MKRICWTFLAVFMITSFSGVCNAMDTIVIGTATYEGIEYNLIYENNNIYGGLVWLDFTTNDKETWETQLNWARSLNNPGVLNYSIDPGFNVVWKGSWRLPVVDEDQANLNGPWPDNSDIGDGTGFGWGGPDENGYHDYSFGVNMVNSEWGNLFYKSLGNSDGEIENHGEFESFKIGVYWSDTEYSVDTHNAWIFDLSDGGQGNDFLKIYTNYAMAVRRADVSPSSGPVKIDDIIAFFDDCVDSGTIGGRGHIPLLSKLRLCIFKTLLLNAKKQIENEKIACACRNLQRALLRSDGMKRPHDFIKGPAALELNDMIYEMLEELWCE